MQAGSRRGVSILVNCIREFLEDLMDALLIWATIRDNCRRRQRQLSRMRIPIALDFVRVLLVALQLCPCALRRALPRGGYQQRQRRWQHEEIALRSHTLPRSASTTATSPIAIFTDLSKLMPLILALSGILSTLFSALFTFAVAAVAEDEHGRQSSTPAERKPVDRLGRSS